MIVSIVSIILLIILSCVLCALYNKKVKELIDNAEELIKDQTSSKIAEAEKQISDHQERLQREFKIWLGAQEVEREHIEQSLITRKCAVEEIIEQLECRRREAEKSHQEALLDGKEKIDIELSGYRKLKIEQVNNEIKKEIIDRRAQLEKDYLTFCETLDLQKEKYKEELALITDQLEDYKKKQNAINEEILRRREVEEKQDFFRVVLNEDAIKDVHLLLSVRENLIFRETLDKLIYDAYISKPVTEMIKRVLKGEAPSGIYKITRMKTGEIYIGKSTDVKKRWAEHCKTAYGVGTIAHSVLHTTIKKDGIENFTFELLEEVPKDKLTEREKYWITFYDSKNYGLNERNG